jgi:hypothetical protein
MKFVFQFAFQKYKDCSRQTYKFAFFCMGMSLGVSLKENGVRDEDADKGIRV